MKNLWLFAFLVLGSLVLFGCADTHLGIYHYTRVAPYAQMMPTYPVYVDKEFGEADQLAIAEALDQWNYVINGHAKFIIVSNTFDMEPDVLREVIGGRAFAVLKITSSNPMVARVDEIVEENDHTGGRSYSLGFTPTLGDHTIYLVRDRVRDNSMVKGLIMHEVGHALGVEHGGDGLMSPGYDALRYQCVDYYTAAAAAKAQGWQADTLNYCVLGAAVSSRDTGKHLVNQDLTEENQRLQTPVDVIRR